MNELDKARKDINEIDEEMARLFERRMQAGEAIARFKQEHGLSVKDPAREAQVIERGRERISDPVIEAYYVDFLKNNIELSCNYQERILNGMKVAYCGVEGAFAYIAARRMFPQARLVPYGDFKSAYNAVSKGDADCAVLPMENSYAGEVGTVTDLLFSGDLYVNQVLDLPVTHDLIALPEASAEDIKTVVSHPQALEQCAEYISKHDFKTQTYSNTALAAKLVKESGDKSVAAIASPETAEIFGLKVLESRINTDTKNTTRFAALSRTQNFPANVKKREDESFILVFTVRNEAGALAQTLNIIGIHGFNMRSLRSRPMKDLLWNYYFYIEAEGNINTENGRAMLQELSAICAKLKLVGTYYSGNTEKEAD